MILILMLLQYVIPCLSWVILALPVRALSKMDYMVNLVGLAGTTVLSIIFYWFTIRPDNFCYCFSCFFMIMRSQRRIALLLLGIVALNLAWAYMPLQYKSRFESIWNPSVTDKTAEESAEGRIEGIKDGYYMLFNRPFLGYGAGTF